jgi:ribonucleoside-triphosphate reductase
LIDYVSGSFGIQKYFRKQQINNRGRPKMAKCGLRTEVYSRVCGYFRPVANWNRGKKEEFKDRRTYKSDSEKKDSKVA